MIYSSGFPLETWDFCQQGLCRGDMPCSWGIPDPGSHLGSASHRLGLKQCLTTVVWGSSKEISGGVIEKFQFHPISFPISKPGGTTVLNLLVKIHLISHTRLLQLAGPSPSKPLEGLLQQQQQGPACPGGCRSSQTPMKKGFAQAGQHPIPPPLP